MLKRTIKYFIKRTFRLIPDKIMLKMKYYKHFKCKLDLKDPKSFNEKIQWLKINDRKDLYTTLVDKILVKEFISKKLGEKYVIKNLGVWEKFDDIDFSKLPDKFVLKCSHDSGSVIVCRDKSKFDYLNAKKRFEHSLKNNYYWNGREWPYKNVKPRIMAEEYLEESNDSSKGLVDFKFYCFNGEPKMLYVSKGLEDHNTAQISFYDLNCNKMPFGRSDYAPINDDFIFPKNFDEMIKISSKLAKLSEAKFVRVDLYSLNGNIYFSEFTFHPCNGFMPFNPSNYDLEVGKWLDIK